MFGLLCYDNSYNLGDNIQSIAAMQYLPHVDVWVDRDTSKIYDYITNKEIEHTSACDQQNQNHKSKKKYKVIYNGWFDSHYCKFPPPAYLDPIMVSFHINDEDHSKDPRYKVLESSLIEFHPIPSHRCYLVDHGPIGCRDQHTKNILDHFNIPSYFSGCLTLTLKRPVVALTDTILVVDAHIDTQPIYHKLPANIREKAVCVTQALEYLATNVDKMKLAQEFLMRIASAKLIITNRLHTLLPALAFHVPVLFIVNNDAALLNIKDPRFAGLICCPVYDGSKEFAMDLDKLTWDYMVQNYGVIELLSHAQKMVDTISRALKKR